MFETFYSSFWQHPLLLWLFPLLFLVVVRPHGSFFARAALVFSVLTVVDPLMTGPAVELLGWQESTANAVMIIFVLLGDYRFFFFVEHFGGARYAEPSPGSLRPYLTAAAWTLIVPVGQALLLRGFPGAFANPRHTFLVYELLFLALSLVVRFVVLPARQLQPDVRAWLNGVSFFAASYYALWVSADVVILAGADAGFLLRVVPNVLYYGLFIPFVFFSAPEHVRTGRSA